MPAVAVCGSHAAPVAIKEFNQTSRERALNANDNRAISEDQVLETPRAVSQVVLAGSNKVARIALELSAEKDLDWRVNVIDDGTQIAGLDRRGLP